MTTDYSDLRERIERLEQHSRRLRAWLIAAAVAISGLMFVAASAAPRDSTFGTVTANKLVIVSAPGRARFIVGPDSARFVGADGRGAVLDETSLTFSGADGLPFVSLAAPHALPPALKNSLPAEELGAAQKAAGCSGLSFFGAGGTAEPTGGIAELIGCPSGASLVLFTAGDAISLDASSPDISVSDGKGYRVDVGSTGLLSPETGETRRTSAASIVMFGSDKDHKVIWQAPIP